MAEVMKQEQEENTNVAETEHEAENETEQQMENEANGIKTESESPKEPSELKEKTSKKSNRYQPYSKEKNAGSGDKKGAHRNRVFVSNIPYDMKWQAIKDLMREKVGEVTYVELFKDAEGKSRVSDVAMLPEVLNILCSFPFIMTHSSVVEFKDDEFVKKAMEIMNKYDLNGRPLNIKEDPDGEHARRVLQRAGGAFQGVRGTDGGMGMINVPPSIANNPNIPPEVINALQAGRLGTTVFVANDDKSVPHDDFRTAEKSSQLPRGLGGIGLGLGPGGQPINANRVSGGGMSSMGPGGLGGMDVSGYGAMSRLGGGMSGYGSGMDGMSNMGGYSSRELASMGRMGGGMDDYRGSLGMGGMSSLGSGMGGMGDMYRSGMGSIDRDYGRSELAMNRGYGDSYGGMGGGMNSMGGGMRMGMDRMGAGYDRLGSGMEMSRGFGGFGSGSNQMGGGMSERGSGSKGCQIFVRNLPFDLTWQKLKEKFSSCGKSTKIKNITAVTSHKSVLTFVCVCFLGQVMFAEVKMENGKSKGCGTVRFDSPETAEKACRLMNGTKISGREIDVRMDRNA
ncbi:MYEF2 factor, partial [Polypterus senegalus]